MPKTSTANDLAAPAAPAAPAPPPAQRQAGGSYTVQPDGTTQRVEHTRDAGRDPDPDNSNAPANPAASQE